jgi:hypothetical protein
MRRFDRTEVREMDADDIKKLAAKNTPDVKINVKKDFYRHNVIASLSGADNVGIELGVAGGDFSKRMVDSGKFKIFYGVDLYCDHHTTDEYKRALKFVGIERNYKLLRMSFDEALALFDDDYFDFIYFDGYAHTGEEGGKTFVDWFHKVKVGGVIAGDDYHDDWPLVKWAVNTFARALDLELSVTGLTETTNLSHYPSWFLTKTRQTGFNGPLDAKLLSLGAAIKASTGNNTPQANNDVTLSTEQILQFCDMLCERFPDKIPDLLNIVQRNMAKAGLMAYPPAQKS